MIVNLRVDFSIGQTEVLLASEHSCYISFPIDTFIVKELVEITSHALPNHHHCRFRGYWESYPDVMGYWYWHIDFYDNKESNTLGSLLFNTVSEYYPELIYI
jgi:hypothetical protein